MSEEYSERFDELRKNRVEVSYHKYGPARKNFKTGNVQALPSMERCIEKYNSTGKTNVQNVVISLNVSCSVRDME